MIEKIITGVKDALFPYRCVECRRDDFLWCDECRASFVCRSEQHCPSCDVATNFGAPCDKHADCVLDGVVSVSWYAARPIRILIKMWKYDYVRDAEELFARIIYKWLNEAQQFPTDDWVVVPVPLHKFKFRQRGFNQAEKLAEMIGAELGIEVKNNVLKRAKFSFKPQAKIEDTLRREARKFDGVFVPVCDMNRSVILVDDVYTTGATMKAAAQALKCSGAKRVVGFALARGH